MQRLNFLILGLLLATASGCAICSTPYDYAYGHYGGATPRADMYEGRVGSAFAPAEGEMEGEIYFEE